MGMPSINGMAKGNIKWDINNRMKKITGILTASSEYILQ